MTSEQAQQIRRLQEDNMAVDHYMSVATIIDEREAESLFYLTWASCYNAVLAEHKVLSTYQSLKIN